MKQKAAPRSTGTSPAQRFSADKGHLFGDAAATARDGPQHWHQRPKGNHQQERPKTFDSRDVQNRFMPTA